MEIKKIIIIVLITLLLILAGITFFLRGKNNTAPIDNQEVGTTTTLPVQIRDLPPPSAIRIKDEASLPLEVKQLAMNFAERYGSYSTDAAYENIEDLKSSMTSKMQEQAKKDFKEIYSESRQFEGVSTVSVSAQTEIKKTDSVVVLVSTQREKTSGELVETVYQSIKLNLIKNNQKWLVDEVQWQ